MKTPKIVLLLSCVLTIAACDKSKNTIAGIYIMNFKSEYSIASDTLIISPFNPGSGVYKIERKDGFHRIRQGKILPEEFNTQSWMAIFEKDHQVLRESAWGRVIYLNNEDHSASFNGRYQKIK